MSRHPVTKSEEDILYHLHGKQLKIEQNPTRWENQNDFESFVKEHQHEQQYLYIVAPTKFLLYAMARNFHFYFFTNNGSIEVHEVKLGKIEALYTRRNKSKNVRHMQNHH